MSKDCEIKTKMGQEQRLKLKMLFLLGYNLKIVIQWGRIDFWWEGSLLGGGGGSRWAGGDEQIFGRWGGLPPVGKIL